MHMYYTYIRTYVHTCMKYTKTSTKTESNYKQLVLSDLFFGIPGPACQTSATSHRVITFTTCIASLVK